MLHWVGPFPIHSIISWVVYHINFLAEYGCIHPIFYVSYLHPHVGTIPTHPPSSRPINDNAAAEFEVEDILYSHLGCYRTEYLVKWLAILFLKLHGNLLNI